MLFYTYHWHKGLKWACEGSFKKIIKDYEGDEFEANMLEVNSLDDILELTKKYGNIQIGAATEAFPYPCIYFADGGRFVQR